jgi:hypothetical protein
MVAMKLSAAPTLHRSHWLWILCLVGLDYFSSLAYQPSIAFEAVGHLAPLATLVVVLLTLCGALPIYLYVAGRSPNGQGAIGLLENLVPGWFGKLLIVVLLGFVATDFTLTRTLSTADAAVHILHNPHPAWQGLLQELSALGEEARQLSPSPGWQKLATYWNKQLITTILLSILAFIFWAIFRRGFTRRVVQLAAVVVTIYLLFNAVVICSALYYLAVHPNLWHDWWARLDRGFWYPQGNPLAPHSWGILMFLSFLAFPKLALGLSGFELSMMVLPLIRGSTGEAANADPQGRVRQARKMLVVAALVMSVYLVGSTLAVTTLIPSQTLLTSGEAANRALAYLAHGGQLRDGVLSSDINPLFGPVFGTCYDLSTVIILCLAGTSVTIGLRDFVPNYLHRSGMEMNWAHRFGMNLYLLNCINVAVTVLFRASVTAQRGAYAASVLVLISSAGVAALLSQERSQQEPHRQRIPWRYLILTVLFHLALLFAVFASPSGLLITLAFVVAILVSSIISRAVRSTELRFEGFDFADAHSEFLWNSLRYLDFPILVPHRPGHRSLLVKEELIRKQHRLAPEVPLVFIEAELGDASAFCQRPLLHVVQEDGRFIIRIKRCCSIPHVIANAALELSRESPPPEVHFGWSDESPIEANISFLLFGKGNIPWMVRELIRRAEPNPERQPRIFIG